MTNKLSTQEQHTEDSMPSQDTSERQKGEKKAVRFGRELPVTVVPKVRLVVGANVVVLRG